MWRELFDGNPNTVLAVGGLLFFVAVFVAVLVWISSRRRTPHYRHMAQMPLQDADDTGRVR